MHVSSRFAFFQFEISEDILRLITFSVLCEWMPSFSRAKPISPELSCFCCQPAGHHARGCLHLSMSQSVSAGHLPPIVHWHWQWLLPSRGRCIMISPFTNANVSNSLLLYWFYINLYPDCSQQTLHQCPDIPFIMLPLIKLDQEKISRGKQKIYQIGHEFHFYKNVLK